MWQQVFQGAIDNFEIFVLGVNYSEYYFTHVILKQALRFCLQEHYFL